MATTQPDAGGTANSPEVDSYLAGVPEPQRSTLAALRQALHDVLPRAEEGIRYAMPAVLLHGKGVAGFAAFADHCAYFPMSGSVIEAAGPAVAGFKVSKGGLHFPVDRPLAIGVVRRLVKLRLAEISDVANGRRREYFPDGRLKATGMMKDGELHGKWQWFRRDGSLSRTGRFTRGEPSGTWETWDRSGNLVSSTKR